jgi:peptidoglycan hydrolase-like protein with peptidoglycan-binding domain
MARVTLRPGSLGPDVMALQKLLLVIPADGVFGPGTLTAVRDLQKARGLVPDGIVGERTWRALGESWAAPATGLAPAVVAALRDANAAWPARSKVSDGTWGDASHQARHSDHNTGDAVDITHDPKHGPDGEKLAAAAAGDPRISYVISNRKIFNPSFGAVWRPYTGSNPHTHHVHISVLKDRRDDDSPWPWAP